MWDAGLALAWFGALVTVGTGIGVILFALRAIERYVERRGGKS